MREKSSNSNEKAGVTRRTFLGTTLLTGAAFFAGELDVIFGAESSASPSVATNPTWKLGGDLTVNRLGFGAMRLTGEGIWGWPPDRANALKVLRRAVELGVNLIDTADAYGPEVDELLIAEALYPYPKDLVIATKGGHTRPSPGQWVPNGGSRGLKDGNALEAAAKNHGVTVVQLALAWLLHRSSNMLPIPGTSSIAHLEENVAAEKIKLTAEEWKVIDASVG